MTEYILLRLIANMTNFAVSSVEMTSTIIGAYIADCSQFPCVSRYRVGVREDI